MIVNRLSRLMGERRLKVADLSRETGIAYSSAWSLYQAKVTRIDFETLDRLCRWLRVTPCDIFEYVPDVPDAQKPGPLPEGGQGAGESGS